jgi:hypothetical protein
MERHGHEPGPSNQRAGEGRKAVGLEPHLATRKANIAMHNENNPGQPMRIWNFLEKIAQFCSVDATIHI